MYGGGFSGMFLDRTFRAQVAWLRGFYQRHSEVLVRVCLFGVTLNVDSLQVIYLRGIGKECRFAFIEICTLVRLRW
jgi:hypothetical protein